MDFISNLIKRPKSLVLNESATETVVTPISPISTSLPSSSNCNNTNDIEESQKLQLKFDTEDHQSNLKGHSPTTISLTQPSIEEQNEIELSQETGKNTTDEEESVNTRPLSMSSSLNGNLTDFIGVPDDYIGQFEDILPPQPPLLTGGEFLLSPMEKEMSKTPSPPPMPMSAAMTASQTLDELLSEITDNFTLAGINDEVLAIASPSSNAELSPLSSKTNSNNSRLFTPTSSTTHSSSSSQMHTPKTPTTDSSGNNNVVSAQSPTPGVSEANYSLHKFPNCPEMETGHLVEDHQNIANVKEMQNTSGVNITSNKFVGLSEFDESKIPDLPGDLNPNIEDQYDITFKDCFIPTLTAEQVTNNEIVLEKTHLLLPNEESITFNNTANDTFSDCIDEKDPLEITADVEQTNVYDTTADNEGYESAVNDITKDVMADVTLEIGANQTQIMDDTKTIDYEVEEKNQSQQEAPMDFNEEPMDIDMNATIEIINKSAENIQNVERVLLHAENILHHLDEEKENIQQENINENAIEAKVIGSLVKPTESSKMTFVVNASNSVVGAVTPSPHLEIEQSNHDVSLNKSVELPVKSAGGAKLSECAISAINGETTTQLENNSPLKELTEKPKNLSIDMDKLNKSSDSGNAFKSPTPKQNISPKSNFGSFNRKNSVPNTPSFPIKQTQCSPLTFPKSPKISLDNSNKPKFLEKSDYVEQMEHKMKSKQNALQESEALQQRDRRRTFLMDEKDQKHSGNSRRTFNINNNEESTHVDSSLDRVVENSVAKNENISRRTFNVSSEEVQSQAANTSLEPMEIDDELNHTNNLHCTANADPEQNSPHVLEEFIQPAASIENHIETKSDINPSNTTFDDAQSSVPTLSDSTPSSEIDTKEESFLPQKQLKSNSPPLPTMNKRSDSSPLPVLKSRTESSPLPEHTIQTRFGSPPLPAMRKNQNSYPLPATMESRSDSPPLPVKNNNSVESQSFSTESNITSSPPLKSQIQNSSSPPIMAKQSSMDKSSNLKQEPSSPCDTPPFLPNIQKRPPIHGFGSTEILSAKEQSNTRIKDEKDEFVEKFTPSPMDEMFTTVSATSTTLTNSPAFSSFGPSAAASLPVNTGGEVNDDEDFQGQNNLILNPSDFDYLLTKGNNNAPVDRSSLLLKFDPLLGVPVPSNLGQQQQQQQIQQQQNQQQQQQQTQKQTLHLQIPTNTLNNNPCLSPTIEEDEHNDSINRSFVIENSNTSQSKGKRNSESDKVKPSFLCGLGRGGAAGSASSHTSASAKTQKDIPLENKQPSQLQYQNSQIKRQLPQLVNKKNATMSVDVIKDMSLDNNDCNKTFEHSNSTQPDDKQNDYKMDELEKKIKNEVLKTEDIEKKLKDAEQREEALIKRITEKDKTVAKMTGVIEAYEKAIAELIAEKEQLIQNYEKQLAEVKADRDSNYHHLTSLETTFSDLHVKYEKSKEMTCHLKGNEEALITENRKNSENLRLQEQRYDKMKNHAMQQLEIANKKLESLTREHTMEITKLKALLKKEEIARSSMSEQLAQKTKENTELVKICDELIQGQGS